MALAALVVVAIGLVAWALTAGSSEAQSGTMQNCPAAGKWSIAVWSGASGTAAADALATCGSGAVDAAYALDAQTGGWLRWFAGKPDVSNLPPFSDMQGVLALGLAIAETPTPVATATATPTTTPSEGGPELGTYRGTTSQGKPIEFDVVEGSQAIGRIKIEAEGVFPGGTCSVKTAPTGVSLPIVDNHFGHSFPGNYSISGTFDSPTTASGKLGIFAGPAATACISGSVSWTASRQP